LTDTAVPQPRGRRLVVVTGLSGAGRTTALKVFEDLGYEAIDNLPVALLGPLIGQAPPARNAIAVTVDSRTRDFSVDALTEAMDCFNAREGIDAKLIYVDSDLEVLERRFTETRRRHPLATDRPVADGLRLESALVGPLRDRADAVFDTSLISPHDLRRLLIKGFALDPSPGLYVTVVSFSFRRGLPREADLVFDVRFLENPHWDPELRWLTGLSAKVQCAIAADPHFVPFMDGLLGLLGPLLPRYNREGKSYLTIALGCTGGKHRSVFVAERLGTWLESQGYKAGVVHRDIPASVTGPC
jgi:UPF0042 nucleotide-binding protein